MKVKIPYQLRLENEMIANVKELAKKNERSVNSEFRNLIEKSLSNKIICGVYKITSPDGFFYIGASKDVNSRFKQHVNSPSNSKLKLSFDKFGTENHLFEVIEECFDYELKAKELYFISKSNHDFILNIIGIKKEQIFYTEEELNEQYLKNLIPRETKFIQHNLSNEAELTLQKLKVVARSNKLPQKSKSDLIELALSLIDNALSFADDETFENIFNLKK